MFSDFRIRKNHDRLYDGILSVLGAVCCVFALLALALTYIARPAIVRDGSMSPTLSKSDLVIIESLGYEPKQGDIVACKGYGLDGVCLRRIAAVPGQTVNIDFVTGTVYVDGSIFNVAGIDNRTFDSDNGCDYPMTVPQGYYFVLCDNRADTEDSRNFSIGLIDREDIYGRAVFRLFPIAKARKL